MSKQQNIGIFFSFLIVFSKQKVYAYYFLVLSQREKLSRDARETLPSLEVVKVARNIFFSEPKWPSDQFCRNIMPCATHFPVC